MNDADPILNYAPIRRRTWREYLQVTVDSLIRIGMLVVLTGVVLVAAAALLRPHYSVERYTHEHYWKVLLNGWGYEVDRDATSIVYVWNGRDTHNYFRLNQAAAAACADKCLQEYVQKQLDILRNAGVANAEDPRLMELGALTGQDVKGDLSVWKA
ncbi:MAG TPA: hypothetical protein VGN88_12045 [Phycisphaerae bacterium]|jgi:hypothetical protein